MLDKITPLVITFNEQENIRRTISKLVWARRIVVVDSGSTDKTLDVLKNFPQVDVFRRTFDTFAEQCNFGLGRVSTGWVLSLDADYELSDELVAELDGLEPRETAAGYRASFVYRIYGRPLRGTLYPARTVLYRVGGAYYENDGHGHRIAITGDVRPLRGVIYHDDRKPLSRWFGSQQRYAAVEAGHLLRAPIDQLSLADRVRRVGWPAPLLVFVHVLFVKGCVLDGWVGWYYVCQRLLAETMLALELLDRRLSGETGLGSQDSSVS